VLGRDEIGMRFFSMSYTDWQPESPGDGTTLVLPGLLVCLFILTVPTKAQEPVRTASSVGPSELFNRVIANQKKSELLLDQYERTLRVEKRKSAGLADPPEAKFWRLFPTGTGVDKLALSADGEPLTTQGYRNELERLEKYLAWIAQDGSAQKDAYAKAERKRKERYDLIEMTHHAFLFTFEGKEMRGDRTLLRYTLAPNPDFKPTTRNAILFTKVRGTLWIDEQSSELAKIEGDVTEDVSLALFLAKIYKGSHFMQERYEIAPGVWEPTFEQFDFDGRKFLMTFSIHERSFYSGYKRVGPPKEAAEVVRAELDKLRSEQAPQ
jgi:hypothetical protein